MLESFHNSFRLHSPFSDLFDKNVWPTEKCCIWMKGSLFAHFLYKWCTVKPVNVKPLFNVLIGYTCKNCFSGFISRWDEWRFSWRGELSNAVVRWCQKGTQWCHNNQQEWWQPGYKGSQTKQQWCMWVQLPWQPNSWGLRKFQEQSGDWLQTLSVAALFTFQRFQQGMVFDMCSAV